MGKGKIKTMSNNFWMTIRLCAFGAVLTLSCLVATTAETAKLTKESVFFKVGETERAQIKANLVVAGVSKKNATWMTSVKALVGKTARQVGPNIFIGDAPAAGNYEVLTLHTPKLGKTLQIIASYQGHVLTFLGFSTGRVVVFEPGGSLHDYTVGISSNDNKRLWKADYRRGKVAQSLTIAKINDPAGEKITYMKDVPVKQAERLVLDDFKVALTYDAKGILTASCRRMLQSGGESGWQYHELPGRGFALISLITGQEELFSPEGRRMGGEDRSLRVAQRKTVISDTSEWMTLRVPVYQNPATVRPPSKNKFGNPTWETVLIENISRQFVEVCILEDGSLMRIVSKSNELAGAPLVICERESHRKEKKGNSVHWEELSRVRMFGDKYKVTPPQPPAVNSLAAHVTQVNLFKGPTEKPYYTDLFAAKETRYIICYIDFTHPSPGKRVKFKVKTVWTEGSGREVAKTTDTMTFEPDWSAAFLRTSWGTDNPGFWKPGVYKATFYVKGKQIGASSFSIY